MYADVGRADEVAGMFATVDREIGPVTALVNNAAMIGPSTRVADLDPADMERLLEVNVMGVVHCTQQALRRMSTAHGGNGGAIVNVSSGASYVGEPGVAVHYAATKGAVTSFTIGLAQEVMAEGVRVNAVSPGPIRTSMPHPGALERGAKVVPAGRAGEPEGGGRGDRLAAVAGSQLRRLREHPRGRWQAVTGGRSASGVQRAPVILVLSTGGATR